MSGLYGLAQKEETYTAERDKNGSCRWKNHSRYGMEGVGIFEKSVLGLAKSRVKAPREPCR